MESEEIGKRYYLNYGGIRTVGGFPLSAMLQLSDLGDSKDVKALVQRCYKDIRSDNKERVERGEKELDISIIDYVCRLATLFLADMTTNHREILLKYSSHKEAVKCFLRYFMKDPLFYLGNSDLERFQEIASFWFIVLNAEINGDKYWNTKTVKDFMNKITRA